MYLQILILHCIATSNIRGLNLVGPVLHTVIVYTFVVHTSDSIVALVGSTLIIILYCCIGRVNVEHQLYCCIGRVNVGHPTILLNWSGQR